MLIGRNRGHFFVNCPLNAGPVQQLFEWVRGGGGLKSKLVRWVNYGGGGGGGESGGMLLRIILIITSLKC